MGESDRRYPNSLDSELKNQESQTVHILSGPSEQCVSLRVRSEVSKTKVLLGEKKRTSFQPTLSKTLRDLVYEKSFGTEDVILRIHMFLFLFMIIDFE